MTQEDEIQHLQVVQRSNRALRKINRHLRRQLTTARQSGDEVFLELCNADISASTAMSDLRDKAGLQCAPDDYGYIVRAAVRALREVKYKFVSSELATVELD